MWDMNVFLKSRYQHEQRASNSRFADTAWDLGYKVELEARDGVAVLRDLEQNPKLSGMSSLMCH
jgi:hypothetical protein